MFLKWVGGKKQHINDIFPLFPKIINNYYEPFLGGGSILFELLDRISTNKIKITGKIYVNDLNANLIWVYKHTQTHFKELNNNVINIFEKYNNLDFNQKQEFYYNTRKEFNIIKNTPECVDTSVKFIFLNRTCFRGLYRENSKGEFNTPFGNYKKIKFELKNVSNELNKVIFSHKDCCEFLREQTFEKGDFVFLDPPYVKICCNSFTKYNKTDYTLTDLQNILDILKNKNFIMSNALSYVLINICNVNNWDYKSLATKRRINSKNPESLSCDMLIINTLNVNSWKLDE